MSNSNMVYDIILLGFGSVGTHLVKLLLKDNGKLPKVRVVGISDSSGGVHHKDGLPLESILKWKEEGNPLNSYVSMDDSVEHFSCSTTLCSNVPCDILLDATPVNLENGGESMSCIRSALSKGTNIVLANKAPLVLAYQDLMMLASLKPVSQVLFSATVCGGLPVVNVGRRDLCCGRIRSVRGIFNSTSNFILSQMENGNSRKEALQIAMERGIAEADPTLDVEGIDTANKLTIIANSILEYSVTLADVSVEGISNVTTLDMEEAKRDGKVIRLVASATLLEPQEDIGLNPIPRYSLSVAPKRVEARSFLGSCQETDMCVVFESSEFETISMKTNEQGVYPTSAAMIRDCTHIIKALETRNTN